MTLLPFAARGFSTLPAVTLHMEPAGFLLDTAGVIEQVIGAVIPITSVPINSSRS